MSVPSFESQREAAASINARRELGLEYEEQIAAGLAERVEQAVWQRHQEVSQETQLELARMREDRREQTQRFTLAIISLGTGIPITAISATQVDPGLIGVACSWMGISAVNLIFAIKRRRRR
jgi:hypothetical protein